MMQYIRESYKELSEEVTWPTWPELQKTTLIVLAGSIFLSVLIALIDLFWINALGLLYGN